MVTKKTSLITIKNSLKKIYRLTPVFASYKKPISAGNSIFLSL